MGDKQRVHGGDRGPVLGTGEKDRRRSLMRRYGDWAAPATNFMHGRKGKTPARCEWVCARHANQASKRTTVFREKDEDPCDQGLDRARLWVSSDGPIRLLSRPKDIAVAGGLGSLLLVVSLSPRTSLAKDAAGPDYA